MKAHPVVRLYVEPPLSAGTVVACTSAQTNYLLNVMRLGAGAEILAFDGVHGEWRAMVRPAGKRNCTLEIRERVREQEEGPDIHYLFAPVKRARLDYMVQKATEMGASALRPVMTRRTVAHRVKLERMRANAIAAAEQCGVLRIPRVFPPEEFGKLLDLWEPARRIVYCDEEAAPASPLAALKSIKPGPLAVLIGPEGGFEEEERARLRSLSFVVPVSLGPRVMRADTAAVAALALVNAVLGDWR